eukprot:Em0007g1082a
MCDTITNLIWTRGYPLPGEATCPVCSASFFQHKSLRAHVLAHYRGSTLSEQWMCSRCKVVYATRQGAANHFAQTHANTLRVEGDVPSPASTQGEAASTSTAATHICEHCDAQFPTIHGLRNHERARHQAAISASLASREESQPTSPSQAEPCHRSSRPKWTTEEIKSPTHFNPQPSTEVGLWEGHLSLDEGEPGALTTTAPSDHATQKGFASAALDLPGFATPPPGEVNLSWESLPSQDALPDIGHSTLDLNNLDPIPPPPSFGWEVPTETQPQTPSPRTSPISHGSLHEGSPLLPEIQGRQGVDYALRDYINGYMTTRTQAQSIQSGISAIRQQVETSLAAGLPPPPEPDQGRWGNRTGNSRDLLRGASPKDNSVRRKSTTTMGDVNMGRDEHVAPVVPLPRGPMQHGAPPPLTRPTHMGPEGSRGFHGTTNPVLTPTGGDGPMVPIDGMARGGVESQLASENNSPTNSNTLPSDPMDSPITKEDVLKTLKHTRHNSAPGPDRLQYSSWKRLDPTGSLIAGILNTCRINWKIPPSWKESTTILIHKGNDPATLDNWRPIVLHNTIYKLYAAIIARKVSDWACRDKIISPSQKGFLPYEGCLEHGFTLRSVLEDSRRRKRPVNVVWLDLKDAFGSVPHTIHLKVLQQSGIQGTTLDVIQDIYHNSTTSVKTQSNMTPKIPCHRGVKQGCPLSPILFNLVKEVIIQAIEEVPRSGYDIANSTVKSLTYADDLCILASSPATIQRMLEKAQTAARWAGLTSTPKNVLHSTSVEAMGLDSERR